MKTRLLILTLFFSLLCGCSSLSRTTYVPSSSSRQFTIGKVTHISNYRVLQTLNRHFCLAIEERITTNTMVIAIATSEDSDPFYDGEIISGPFVMIDTYTYETNPDERGIKRVKSVPLVVPKSDYLKMKDTGSKVVEL